MNGTFTRGIYYNTYFSGGDTKYGKLYIYKSGHIFPVKQIDIIDRKQLGKLQQKILNYIPERYKDYGIRYKKVYPEYRLYSKKPNKKH